MMAKSGQERRSKHGSRRVRRWDDADGRRSLWARSCSLPLMPQVTLPAVYSLSTADGPPPDRSGRRHEMKLPKTGRPRPEVMAALKDTMRNDGRWDEGRTFFLVYGVDED